AHDGAAPGNHLSSHWWPTPPLHGLLERRGLSRGALVVNEPHFLPYGGVHTGVAAFMAMMPKVLELMDVSQMRVERFIGQGDRVIGIIRMPDRATGEEVLLAEESLIRDG